MKLIFTFVFALFTFLSVFSQNIAGSWHGVLKVQGTQLQLAFNITKSDTVFRSTMDSPDQGAFGIPVTQTTFENPNIKFEITNANIIYQGVLKDSVFIGVFKQGGQEFPLNLTRDAVNITAPKRTQTIAPPYSYESEDLVFTNEQDGISLAGTFTYPKEGSKFPSVILISGSGAQDRNSEIMDHKPFLVLSDYLTSQGIAVLRMDDRGAGASTGIHDESTLQDFVNDIKSAVTYLKSRPEIDPLKLGLIGHSIGGVIAPLVASETTEVSFMVLIAAPSIPGDQLMLAQKKNMERQMGVSEAELALSQQNMKGAYDIILNSKDSHLELQKTLERYFSKTFGSQLPENQIAELSKQLTIPWLIDFIRWNPQIALGKLSLPILALNGSNDLQVSADENLAGIAEIFKKNGNTKVETLEMAGLNHLFQESVTGLPNEYATIEQTFSPKALKVIADWILKNTHP